MCGKNKTSKQKKKLGKNFEKYLPKICLAIAIFDLSHALFFAIQATISLISSFDAFAILALLGTIFWVLIVVLFIVGLWKKRPPLVKAWLGFSIVGFVADIGVLLWGIGTSITVDWNHLQQFFIIFVGIFIESTCIYLVRRYYLIMDPCRLVDVPESGGKKKRKKQLDAKACRESKKKKPTKKPAKKTKK